MQKVIVKLMGGLGNQMFQYAVGYKIAKRLNLQLILDTNFLEDRTTGVVYRNFDLSIFKKIKNELNNLPNQQNGCFIINEENKQLILSNELKNVKNDIYVDGFFQVYNLIDDCMKEIFIFDEYENKDCFLIDYESTLQDNVMINVRRGDYVTRPSAKAFHGVLEMDYFNKAIEMLPFIPKKIFVFSDDVEWCFNNFKDDKNVVIKHELAGEKFKDYLQMMSKFSSLIIPNSTFAWWAAWISEKNGTAKNIIAPGTSLWFSGSPGKSVGLIPTNWKTLERVDL